MRQIFLDKETNGLDPKNESRLIEVACVEVIEGKTSGKNVHSHVNDAPSRARSRTCCRTAATQ